MTLEQEIEAMPDDIIKGHEPDCPLTKEQQMENDAIFEDELQRRKKQEQEKQRYYENNLGKKLKMKTKTTYTSFKEEMKDKFDELKMQYGPKKGNKTKDVWGFKNMKQRDEHN